MSIIVKHEDVSWNGLDGTTEASTVGFPPVGWPSYVILERGTEQIMLFRVRANYTPGTGDLTSVLYEGEHQDRVICLYVYND